MLSIFKKKKLCKRVIVLNAIPYGEPEFKALHIRNTSDFIRSISNGNTETTDEAWNKFKRTAKQINSTLSMLVKWGATVVSGFTLDDLKTISGYDIAIVIAHHSDNSDKIEIGGDLVSTDQFVDAFPINLSGTVDLTSCYSAYLIPKLKARNPYCKFIGIDVATTISFRLFLLEEVLKLMRDNDKISYKEALTESLTTLSKLTIPLHADIHVVDENSIKLGTDQLKSTVFAPASIARGQDFLVQIFLHGDDDTDEVVLAAQMVDENATVRNSKNLSFKIQKGDKVEFQLMQLAKSKNDFDYEDDVKGFIYEGYPNSTEFFVSVSEDCKKEAFVGKIKIAVNKLPVGDILFKTVITTLGEQQQNTCAHFEFNRFDTVREQANANSKLINHILNARNQIHNSDDNTSNRSRVEIEICDKCLEILNSNRMESNSILRVFISSTSDMKKYRLVIKEQVDSCEMYADMYELWGQGNEYPRDMCCRHVIDSDIFVCILGSNYGFVEPNWGLSMTEIEYRIAERCGMPILIYIDSNWQSNVGYGRGNESADLQYKRQEELITELSSSRLVHFFQNENRLALQSIAELLTIKNRMIYGPVK